MVNFYNIIDFIFILIILFFIDYSYKNKTYLKVFEYFKIFLVITISAKLSSYTAIFLQKFYITKADTYTTLILISFILNVAILYFGWRYIFKFTKNYINSEKAKIFFAKLFTVIEVVVISTFSIYIFMQIYICKIYIYPTLKKSYTYPKIEKFYHSFLNDDFINMVLSSDTGTNHKEVIFKSFKNSF